MNEDMSSILENLSDMLSKNEIPENLRGILNDFIPNNSESTGSLDSASALSSIINAYNNTNFTNEKNKYEVTNKSESSNMNVGDFSVDRTVNDNVNSNSNPMNNIDIATILKIKKIMDSINSHNSSNEANLLRSLKPFLRKNQQDRIEQCIKLLNLANCWKLFNSLNE